MTANAKRKSRMSHRRGLSLIEALISLAIAAMLLIAVAAAYQASADAIRLNDEFFRATQAARVTMTRVLSDVRRADTGFYFADGSGLEVDVRDANDNRIQRTYAYDAVNKQITMTQTTVATGTVVTATMARNVESARFDSTGTTVSLTLVVKAGSTQVELNGSATPRTSLVYQ